MPAMHMCAGCGNSFLRYNTIQKLCPACTLDKASNTPPKPRTPLKRSQKPIKQQGKHAKLWRTFRDKVAIPYLDAKYGHVCSVVGCNETQNLDVDHIFSRGAHPELRYVVTNLRYLCRPHHQARTDKAGWAESVDLRVA